MSDGAAAADRVNPPTWRRRGVIAAIASAPAVLAVGHLVASGRAVIPFLRPPTAGSSTARCAQCGADDHTMLDASCPAAPAVV